MKYIFLLFMGLWVSGCISTEGSKGPTSGQQQILVEAQFIQGEDVLSAPRVMVLDGMEACVKIVQETSTLGLEVPVDTGVALTLTPRLEKGRVIFRGSCQVKESVGTRNHDGLSTVAFQTREAFFVGTANSGQMKRVRVNHKNGQSLEVTLKFTVMVHNTSHAQLR